MKHFVYLLIVLSLGTYLSCKLDKVDDPGDCANPPSAAFLPDKTSGNAPLTVNFDNNSTDASTYAWNFGDGNSSTTASPQHIYTTAGTHVVKMFAISGNCKDSSTVTITVNATGPTPVAAFTITNGGCIAPCQVIFTNTSTDATAFEWDFGDGTPKSSAVNPSHTYSIPGDYIVTLKATSIGGAVDTETKTLQVFTRKFLATFGGGMQDRGRGIVQNAEGSYMIVGETSSLGAGLTDIYLLKVDDSGERVGEYPFGTTLHDDGLDIIATTDGNYVLVGSWYLNQTNNADVVLMKVNPLGQVLWQKYFGGTESDQGNRVMQTPDGGFVVLGITNSEGAGQSDYYLIKTDHLGNLTWKKTFGTANEELGLSLALTADGGYAMAGVSQGSTIETTFAYFVKADANGNEVFAKFYLDTYYGTGVIATLDGGYLLSISYLDNSSGLDTKLVKTDNIGVVLWEKVVASGIGNDFLYLGAILTDGYILAGTTDSMGAGESDILLTKTDLDGIVLWSETYGGLLREDGGKVIQTADGGFIIVGSTESSGAGLDDVYLIKTDKDGNAQ